MATVFRARQKALDRVVAVKVLPPSIAKDAEFLERFQREARASAKLNHPNLVLGIDVGQDEATGLWYFAMELVDGPSLKEALKEQRVIPEQRALAIAMQVAKALECIAAHGMVHRDVKPDNILLTKDGAAKLADLGLAKRVADDASLTQAGSALGTPHYMAPEQVRGLKDEIDIRTDIYALGATLFHIVTGQTPFHGATAAEIMSKHLTAPVPNARKTNPAVSEACSRLIERMMQKKREDRAQTPAELLKLLDKAAKGEVLAPRAASRSGVLPHVSAKRSKREAAGRARSRSALPVFIALVAVAALALAGAAVFFPGKIPELLGLAPAALKNEDGGKPAKAEPKPGEKNVGTAVSAETPDKAQAVPAAGEAEKNAGQEAPGKTPRQKAKFKLLGEKAATEDEAEFVGPPVRISYGPPAPGEVVAAGAADQPEAEAKFGFRGDYYVGESFDTLKGTQQDPVIDFRWPAGVPQGYMPRVGFSVKWSGFVEPPESGDYVFEIVGYSGARLYIGTCLLFDAWSARDARGKSVPVSLQKGKKYPLRFEIHNRRDSAAVASLKWGLADGPSSFVRAELPEAVDPAAPAGSLAGGWKADYGKWGNDEPLVTRTELAIAWNWGSGSPAPEIPPNRFWSRWKGLVVPPETGDYVFHAASERGARLFINDVLVLDYYNVGGGRMDSPPLRLEKGKSYLASMEHIQAGEEGSCSLNWSSKDLQKAPVRAQGVGDPSGVLPPAGFLAQYGLGDSTKVLQTRREIQAGWNWKNGPPAPEISGNRYWVHYTGWIIPPADGEYTFSADCCGGLHFCLDDVFLYDSGMRGQDANVDFGPLALKGGKHYFLYAEYWKGSDDGRLLLSWRAPDMPKRRVTGVLPETYSGTPAAEARGTPGLPKDLGRIEAGVVAEYGNAEKPKTTLFKRLEGRMVHNFFRSAPAPEIMGQSFWGRWVGGLKVPAPGQYAFQLEAEAAAELKLGSEGTSIVKVGGGPKPVRPGAAVKDTRPPVAESPPLPLSNKQIYFLQLSFTSARLGSDTPSYIKLLWKPPGKTEYEEIPPDALVMPVQAKEITRRLPK